MVGGAGPSLAHRRPPHTPRARRGRPPTSPSVWVRHRPEPFAAGPLERLEMPPGLTILGILDAVQPDPVLRAHCHVTLDGELVPREVWPRLYPKAGTELAVSVMPADGQTALRAVLLVAVAVLAVAAPYSLPATSAFAAGTLGGSLLAAGIPSAGYLAVNALPPPVGAAGA